ncbi:MAG: hypothetical protein ACTJLM_04880 [Ehrlichia sp.]
MKKSIVKGIAVSLVLGYVSAVSALYFTKFIELDFNNVKDIAKIVAPFAILFICAALLLSGKLDKYIEKDVGTNPAFDELLKKIMSDLESLVSEPVGKGNFKDAVESISESHEKIKNTGPVFFFSSFESYFSMLLSYAVRNGIFKTSKDKVVVCDDYELRNSHPIVFLRAVLFAQLVMKNPMLGILYPEDKIPYIVALSQISVEHYSEKDRQDTARKIKTLLEERVYGCASYSELHNQLSARDFVTDERGKSLSKPSVSELNAMEPSRREAELNNLLRISRLKYCCAISDRSIADINDADRIIGECIKDPDLAHEIDELQCYSFEVGDDITIFKMRKGRVIKAEQPKASVNPTGAPSPSEEKGPAAASLA